MKQIVIDGNRFSNEEEFYTEIDRLLVSPSSKTGHNLDAFADILYGGFGVHEPGEKLRITWINAEKSKEDLGCEETARHWEHILKICHPSSSGFVAEKLQNAENRCGDTLFDTITAIIPEKNGDRDCELTLID